MDTRLGDAGSGGDPTARHRCLVDRRPRAPPTSRRAPRRQGGEDALAHRRGCTRWTCCIRSGGSSSRAALVPRTLPVARTLRSSNQGLVVEAGGIGETVGRHRRTVSAQRSPGRGIASGRGPGNRSRRRAARQRCVRDARPTARSPGTPGVSGSTAKSKRQPDPLARGSPAPCPAAATRHRRGAGELVAQPDLGLRRPARAGGERLSAAGRWGSSAQPEPPTRGPRQHQRQPQAERSDEAERRRGHDAIEAQPTAGRGRCRRGRRER